jgi:hypothetical protein
VISFVLTAAAIAMIVPLIMMGYQITVPLFVLEAAALIGSAFVHAQFAKARSLDVNAA